MGVLKRSWFHRRRFRTPDRNSQAARKPAYSGKLLLASPDLLLLDEPTNHLDMESISWLKPIFLNYPGAVFTVSHDRYFLTKSQSCKLIEGEICVCTVATDSAYALKSPAA